MRRRPRGQLLEQTSPDPAPLVVVGDGERDLGGVAVAQPDVARERDDAIVRDRGDECTSFRPVGVERGFHQPRVDARMTVEAQVEALVRELGEEPDERRGVGAGRLAEAQRAAVAQDHVDGGGSGHRPIFEYGPRQCDIVPWTPPTFSRPTWPWSTAANACDTNG